MRRLWIVALLAALGGGFSMTAARSSDAPTAPGSVVVAQQPDAAAVRRARFGVGLADGDPEQVQTLGLEWFTYCCNPDKLDLVPPEGTRMLRYLPTDQPLDEARVRDLMQRFPGEAWMVGNEPNVKEIGNTEPDAYADILYTYAAIIRDADPTAILVGPNVLNWDFTCVGCAGYPSGREWTDRMRAVYTARYGEEPPLDVWSLHTYELDWVNLPNGNAQRNIDQVTGMRAWLDSISALAGKPIWITEMGLHWGYPGMEFRDGRYYPTGEFAWDVIERYMREYYGWLDANAEALNIQKWFVYTASIQVWESYTVQPTGIRLMDGPDARAPINRLGRVYQELAGVLPPDATTPAPPADAGAAPPPAGE